MKSNKCNKSCPWFDKVYIRPPHVDTLLYSGQDLLHLLHPFLSSIEYILYSFPNNNNNNNNNNKPTHTSRRSLVSISKINKKDIWRQICGFNLYCAGVSNLLITISKYYTYGIGGTWGTFDPLNAGEPWRFLDQVYFKKSQGKSFFFGWKSPKSPRIHTCKICHH